MILKQLADALLEDHRAVKRIARDAGVDDEVTYKLANHSECNPMLGTLAKLCRELGYRMVLEKLPSDPATTERR